MRIVSPFLKRALYPALCWSGVFRRTAASGLAVVTYHGVLPQGYKPIDSVLDGNLISADRLRRQLRLLRANYNVISPEDARAWREGKCELPPRAVLLTCDDGLLNNLTDMLPVLRQEGMRCLFFVTGASAGDERTMLWYEDLLLLLLRVPAGPCEISSEGVVIRDELGSPEQRRMLWWNSVKRLSQISAEVRRSFLRNAHSQLESGSRPAFDAGDTASCRRFGLLTAPELCELAAAGMTVGAHTMSHPMLSEAPPDSARTEMAESRAKLESVLQSPVWAFAYPFGDPGSVTPQVLAMGRDTGYVAAFLNFGGGLGAKLPPYSLPRVHVTSEMSIAEFEAHVSGFHGRLQRLSGHAVQVAMLQGPASRT
ncbi:MAG: polysaccharide deacetylase family protein [Candidatus Sulfotelmatobacter sp.]